MSQVVHITLITAGLDTGPFNLLSNLDGFIIPFESNVPKPSLEAGYTSYLVPDDASIVRVRSNNPLCNNYIDLLIPNVTTTTTSSSTTTSSTSSTTTTTTTNSCIGVADNVRLGNNVGTVCDQPEVIRYTGGEEIAPGSIIYNDICLTSPVTGFSFIVDVDSGEIFNLNSINGQVGSFVGTC